MSEDIIVHYMVNKNTDKNVDVGKVILAVRDYIQNKDAFFDYGPSFIQNVLIFGIVGTEDDHKLFQDSVSVLITELGCKLNILHQKTYGKEEVNVESNTD